jgi:hypothetical protein
MMSSGLATRGLLGGRSGGGGGSVGPFDAIRQRLMQHGVGPTPGLMQSYQNQAGSVGASQAGGPVGNEVVTGENYTGPGAVSMESMIKGLGITDPTQRMNLLAGGANANRVKKMYGSRWADMSARLAGPKAAPKAAGGSFYQQTLSGTGPENWKWNKTARQGTQSNQSPF